MSCPLKIVEDLQIWAVESGIGIKTPVFHALETGSSTVTELASS